MRAQLKSRTPPQAFAQATNCEAAKFAGMASIAWNQTNKT